MTSRVSHSGLRNVDDLTVLNMVEKDSTTTRNATDGQPKSPDGQCGTPFPSPKLGEYAELHHACDLIEVLKGSHAISPQGDENFKLKPRGALGNQTSNDLGFTEQIKAMFLSVENSSDLRAIQAKLDQVYSMEQDLRSVRTDLEHLKAKLQRGNDTARPQNKNFPRETSVGSPGEVAVLSAFSGMLREMRLPKLEIQPFSGSSGDFLRFMTAFDANVASKVDDPRQRLSYLLHHCNGLAKEAIEHCALLPKGSCYDTAIEILTDFFGRPDMIVEAVLKDLLQGPPVPLELRALQRLLTEMRRCHAALSCISRVEDLNNHENSLKLFARLPKYIQRKWADSSGLDSSKGSGPTFEELMKLVRKQISVMSNKFGKLAFENMEAPSNKEPPEAGFGPSHSHETCTSETCETSTRDIQVVNSHAQSPCILCEKNHGLESCPAFIEKKVVDRRRLLSNHKRCFLCLRANHVARSCKSEMSCTEKDCGGRHHHLVHCAEAFPKRGYPRGSEPNSTASSKEPPEWWGTKRFNPRSLGGV